MNVGALLVRLPHKQLHLGDLARVAREPHKVVARVRQLRRVHVLLGVLAHRARLGVVVGRVDIEIEQVLGRVLSDTVLFLIMFQL